jgi:hypothetical protein
MSWTVLGGPSQELCGVDLSVSLRIGAGMSPIETHGRATHGGADHEFPLHLRIAAPLPSPQAVDGRRDVLPSILRAPGATPPARPRRSGSWTGPSLLPGRPPIRSRDRRRPAEAARGGPGSHRGEPRGRGNRPSSAWIDPSSRWDTEVQLSRTRRASPIPIRYIRRARKPRVPIGRHSLRGEPAWVLLGG